MNQFINDYVDQEAIYIKKIKQGLHVAKKGIKYQAHFPKHQDVPHLYWKKSINSHMTFRDMYGESVAFRKNV